MYTLFYTMEFVSLFLPNVYSTTKTKSTGIKIALKSQGTVLNVITIIVKIGIIFLNLNLSQYLTDYFVYAFINLNNWVSTKYCTTTDRC